MIDINHIFDASGGLTVSLEVNIPLDLFSTAAMERELPNTIQEIVLETKRLWDEEADARLWTSRDEYKKAITISWAGSVGTVSLVGEIANYIEAGGDMKPFLLASSKVKYNKDGMAYNVIPIKSIGGPQVFRTVTDLSPPTSWVHKGEFIADDVETAVTEHVIPDLIDRLIDRVIG